MNQQKSTGASITGGSILGGSTSTSGTSTIPPKTPNNTERTVDTKGVYQQPSSSTVSDDVSINPQTLFVIKGFEQEKNNLLQQIDIEKAGKRKLFHSLMKVAYELHKTRKQLQPYIVEDQYNQKNWYDGGMWRSPTILPNITTSSRRGNNIKNRRATTNNNAGRDDDRLGIQPLLTSTSNPNDDGPGSTITAAAAATVGRMGGTGNRTGQRSAVSLSELFFDLVIVTAFTRVGVSISQIGYVDIRSVLYFGIFWTVWSKQASYSTRFDTSDLSATVTTLITCFAVLFASLSVQGRLYSIDGTRIMIMAAFVAALNCFLHIRVAYTVYKQEQEPLYQQQQQQQVVGDKPFSTTEQHEQSTEYYYSSLNQHIINYAVFNIILTAIEFIVWMVGIVVFPYNWEYRNYIFVIGLLVAQRMPRAFLANDFHAACSRRGVLFILLLGFLLQSVVVVASEFFAYQTPEFEHYSFIGAACLMFFCIKLLYVDDSETVSAQDHALLVNRYAGFLFNIGNFTLLLSTTVMGSGLNLLTHEYLAATAALPGPAKTLVCGGFSAVLLSTFFIKSMHVKRVPLDKWSQSLFIGAYLIQGFVLLLVVGVTGAMSLGYTNAFLERTMQYESVLLFILSGSAFIVVIMDWLDEGLELLLYDSVADSRMYRVHPFGIWCCFASDVTADDFIADNNDGTGDTYGLSRRPSSTFRLSTLSPLLGSSIANMKGLGLSSGNLNFYQSIRGWGGDQHSSTNLRQQNYV